MSEKYIIIEKVYGSVSSFHNTTPISSHCKCISITPFVNHLEISYAFESSKSPSEILPNRLKVSEIIQGITGFGYQNYESKLYHMRKENADLQSFVTRNIHSLDGVPILSSEHEMLVLVKDILKAQLGYSSELVNWLLASFGQTNIGGMINAILAWAWWGLEWLIRSLDQVNPVQSKLQYKAVNPVGKVENIRTVFKKELDKFLKSFSKNINTHYTMDNELAFVFREDMKIITQRLKTEASRNSFMILFDNHVFALWKFVHTFLKQRQNWSSSQDIENLFGDWDSARNLIRLAKKARDSGFHMRKLDGLLTGTRYTLYNNLQKFRCWMSCLLAIVLTNSPINFDKHATKKLSLIPLPLNVLFTKLTLPINQGIIKWNERHNGNVVERTANVSQLVLLDERLIEIGNSDTVA